jgi:predicted nucleotidyltransferase
MEILSISISQPSIIAIYGFGSSFRSDSYQDVDLLAILENESCKDPLIHKTINVEIKKALRFIDRPIDVTVLTEKEATRKPLRESDSFIPIFLKTQNPTNQDSQ